MSNLDRWNRARFTRSTQINEWAAKIVANRSRYEAVSRKTGVPWDVIGVIHYRESSLSFAGVLHNGQKIIGTGKKTTLVPKGRGPFSSWEEAAVDALVNCAPYLAKHKDWSIAGTLDALERYNGLGYRNKGLPSPYLWAGTDQYTKGKYVKDGKYDPNHVDKQLGVAALLMKIREEKAAPAPKPELKPEPKADDEEKLAKSKRFWSWLFTALGAPLAAFGALDWRVQLAIVAVIVGFAIYAIQSMPAVRKKLGLS